MNAGHLVRYIIIAAVVLFAVIRVYRRRAAGRPVTALGGWLGSRRAASTTRTGRAATSTIAVTRLVASREVRQRVRGRVFRFATLLLLVGVAAAVLIPVATRGKSHPQQVGLVGSSSASLRTAVTAAAHGVGTSVTFVDEPNLDAAQAGLRSGSIDVVIVDGNQLVVHKAISSGDTSKTAQFARVIAQTLGAQKAIHDAGLTAAQAEQLARARPLPITSLQAPTGNSPSRSTAVIGLIVLFILMTQYLSWTLVGVMEEKSSRVVEVLLATVRPLQLLAGKVVGIGAVVFAQAGLVAAFALILGRAVGSDLLHGTAPLVLLSTFLWLILGYAFYSWLYAAAGSLAERQDQVQALALPLSLPMIAGYILGLTVIGAGTAPIYMHVLAYVPFTAPFAMTALVGLGAVSWWQFVLSVLVSLASTIVVARLAATVYRRAILRTGRRVRLREVIGNGPKLPSGPRLPDESPQAQPLP